MIIWPIFVFLDDTTLDVCESLEDARMNYEGIDVESGIYRFYDFSGAYLKPAFSVPNRTKSLFGVATSISSGVFHFEIHDIESGQSMVGCLENTEALNPTDRFSDLSQILSHLKGQGVAPS